MKRQIKAIKVLTLVLLTFGSIASRAQTITGSVNGTVTDPSGAVIPNAKVSATNTDTSIVTATTTNNEGIYNIRFLQIGNDPLCIRSGWGQPRSRERVPPPARARHSVARPHDQDGERGFPRLAAVVHPAEGAAEQPHLWTAETMAQTQKSLRVGERRPRSGCGNQDRTHGGDVLDGRRGGRLRKWFRRQRYSNQAAD